MLPTKLVALCRLKSSLRSLSPAFRGLNTLRSILEETIPEKQQSLLKLKKEHGSKSLGEVTIDQCIGGARGVKSLLWETSNLDPMEGIRFRGLSIPECQEKLPGYTKGGEPIPEALFWLLLTGEVPTKAQCDELTEDLHARSTLPPHIEPMIRSFPKEMHPMTMFAASVAAMQTSSEFAPAYGTKNKKDLWMYAYEDVLNVVARLPEVAALIYRLKFKDGTIKKDTSLDYSGNFNRMLGYTDASFDELMRLYLVIHSDHEGGNASAHATHLVGSALSDPYLSFTAGLCALAGPLHGLANQEVLKWIKDLQKHFAAEGREVNSKTIEEFVWQTLNSGKVIPGYGHAVLRKTDPRYSAQRQFALKNLPQDDELFNIVSTIYDVVPGVLQEQGKVKNPWPNVDAHSGVLLSYYGLTEYEYYTVLFGVSRAIGALSQLFWDRALGLPLERPKSVTPDFLWDVAKK
eukprot:223241_1